MKNSTHKKYLIPIVIIILIILISIILITSYLKYIRELTQENTLKNLGEVAKQDAKNIKDSIEEHKRILETIINATNQEEPKTEQGIFKIYERNAGKQEFSRIAILYNSGKTSTSDGEIVDLSEDTKYFFQTDEIQITKTRKSKVDTEEINIYSKKTKWNNQVVVILLVVETDKYEQLFSQSIYNGKGVEYLITGEGEITANSRDEENGNNIFEELKNDSKDYLIQNEDSIEKMENDINNKLNGQIIYIYDNNNYYISYQVLEIEDWYLVLATPGSVIAEELNKILEITFIIALTIIIIIFIVSTYIIINNMKKREKLYKLAYIDSITKLGNKNYLFEKGKEYLEKNKKNNYIIILDIDNFKSFNKKYGHKIGDNLLYEIGEILKNNLNKNSIITRLANDVYGIIFEENNDINKKIKEIENKLELIKIKDKEYRIYISIGVYKIKENEQEIEKIIDKALIAHNTIKGNYDKQYMFFDETLEEKLEKEHEIEINMQKAIDNEEFKIYYQPKISTSTEKIEGAEALVRWQKDNKIIPPNEFIPLFERNQFIIKLDTYIFEKVCKDIAKWKKEYKKIPLVSINVSKEHLTKDNFIKEYIQILEKYNLEPNELEIEITESAATELDIISIIKEMKKAGFIISIDDFGTGYSSLSMIQEMPIDTIKIDKAFIDQINLKNSIVQYIILIAKKLNFKTVAEGVENIEQVKYLKELGCNLIQGYFYSKPLNKDDFEEYFKNN